MEQQQERCTQKIQQAQVHFLQAQAQQQHVQFAPEASASGPNTQLQQVQNENAILRSGIDEVKCALKAKQAQAKKPAR